MYMYTIPTYKVTGIKTHLQISGEKKSFKPLSDTTDIQRVTKLQNTKIFHLPFLSVIPAYFTASAV